MIAKRIKSAWQIAMYDSEGKQKFFCSAGGVGFAVEKGAKVKTVIESTKWEQVYIYHTDNGEAVAMLKPEECAFFSQNIPTESGKTAVVEMGVCP